MIYGHRPTKKNATFGKNHHNSTAAAVRFINFRMGRA